MLTLAAENGSLVTESLHHVVVAVQVIGSAVLVWGVALAVVKLLALEACRFSGKPYEAPRSRLRVTLGYYLQLGLEILIAADIIETIVKPDIDSLITLGVVVVIRTVISVSLNWELKHERAGEPAGA